MKNKGIAFFDFDGTLTKSDSLMHFLFFYFSFWEVAFKGLQFIPFFFFFKIIQRDNAKAKQALFRIFFKGHSEEVFNKQCERFSTSIIPKLIQNEVFKRLKWHQDEGDEVVVVSASIENYLKPYFNPMGIIVIGTRLKVRKEKLSGYFDGKNCNGDEKKLRIEKRFKLTDYEKSYAYGNSAGDNAMLELVDEAFFRYPEKNTSK